MRVPNISTLHNLMIPCVGKSSLCAQSEALHLVQTIKDVQFIKRLAFKRFFINIFRNSELGFRNGPLISVILPLIVISDIKCPNTVKVSNISRPLAGYKIVDHSDVVGASPVGAAPTTFHSRLNTWLLLDWAKTTARRDEKQLSLGIACVLYKRFYGN